jgi:DNA polymerase-3 subunit delta'
MEFAQIHGLQDRKNQLLDMVGGNRLPHALLLAGPPGGGQLALALALAQYLLCEQPTSGDACGRCASCRKTEKLAHPDLHLSFLYIDPKKTSEAFLEDWRNCVLTNPFLSMSDWLHELQAENKQGKIYKQECQRIIQKLNLKAFESEQKVLVLWRPEFLGNEGNRLLKLIEEPPLGSVILLVAEDTELILQTILSRCQLIQVRPFSDEEIGNGLQAGGLAGPEEALGIAQLAAGDYNRALKLAGSSRRDFDRLFLQWMRSTYEGRVSAMMDWVSAFAKLGRDAQKQFLHYALHFTREFLMLKVHPEAVVRLRASELETAWRMATLFDLKQISELTECFTRGIAGIERNANARILLLDSSLQMHRIQRGKPALIEAGEQLLL